METYRRFLSYWDVARSAMQYSCSRQRNDGSWWTARTPSTIGSIASTRVTTWIVSKRYTDNTGDGTFRESFRKGLSYFSKTFIEPDGKPRYYHDRTYPLDIQCAAQAIETLAFCSD